MIHKEVLKLSTFCIHYKDALKQGTEPLKVSTQSHGPQSLYTVDSENIYNLLTIPKQFFLMDLGSSFPW